MRRLKTETKAVLLLGVGGVSMHQLAHAYFDLGYKVYGYDAKLSDYTRSLADLGVEISTKFEPEFTYVDFCVKTGAIKDDNKYIKVLRKRGVEIRDRAEALSQFCSYFKHVIAVAGTHGKSTTASLIYEILRSDGRRVSCHIGADVFAPRFNINDEYLVVEACEYNKSFLKLSPTISVITNVEAEHMDSYKSMFNLRSAFATFLRHGQVRFAFDCPSTRFLRRNKSVNFVGKNPDPHIKPKILGEYNRDNISLALAVCEHLGVDKKVAFKAVNGFVGIPRRYEFIGKIAKTKIFIDYAHHPTELDAFTTIFNSQFPQNIVVFQPHTYSRTKSFLCDFVRVLKKQNEVIIFKEYPAREKPSAGLSAYQLYAELKNVFPRVKYCASMKNLIKNLHPTDAIAFVGAGDINEIAKKIVKRYSKNG